MPTCFALVDCNNFYVSCERLFAPNLRDKPVAVLSNNDGCIISRSEEVKALGVPMGAPVFKYREFFRRHGVATFSSNFALYGDMSRRVMEVLADFSPRIEKYSIDEAFLDFSRIPEWDLEAHARRLRETILKWTGIPVSIGIAHTKTLAKMANRLAKKSADSNGILALVTPPAIRQALNTFPVQDVWGVGFSLGPKLQRSGINTAGDLARKDDLFLRKAMGIGGIRVAAELRGISCNAINDQPEPRKQVSVSRTFPTALRAADEIRPALAAFAARAGEKLRTDRRLARAMTIYIETDRFRPGPQTHSTVTLRPETATNSTPDLTFYANEALRKIMQPGYAYKKAGIILHDLIDDSMVQQSLFGSAPAVSTKSAALMQAVDAINHKHAGSIAYAGTKTAPRWQQRFDHLSPQYTTRWEHIPKVA